MIVIYYDDYFCITFGSDLICNNILRVKNLFGGGVRGITFNILLHAKAVPILMGN
jgi:hypothetical protein